jgi:hypothetical protein
MTEHPGLEELAELADGTLAPDTSRRVRSHLAVCRSCTAAYADAVRYRAAWLVRPEFFAAGEIPVPIESGPGGSGRPRARRVAWSAAAGIAIATGIAWVATTGRAPTLGFGLPPAVRTASEWASARGLVLPGGDRLADRSAPVFRSGEAVRPPGLEREVDSLVVAYEGGERDVAHTTRVVAGLLAMDDLDAARGYAREGLLRSPGDVPLLTCAAAADYRRNDLGAAESRLRFALARAPHDPVVALDLALVLRQRGETTEAAQLLARAAHGTSPTVASRARRELGAP